jgi:hypothetical protein
MPRPRRKSWRRRGELFELPPQRCADFDESMLRKHSVLFWSGKVTGHRREGYADGMMETT